MAPADKASTPILVAAEVVGGELQPLRFEETATRLAQAVIAGVSGHVPSRAPASALEHRRIAEVLRHIEDHAADPLDLDALASVARLSKYHFLRVFRQAIGMAPYQFLLNVRMRRAAVRLARSSETILSIALDAGFGDLSTFNKRFRGIFGVGIRRRTAKGASEARARVTWNGVKKQ